MIDERVMRNFRALSDVEVENINRKLESTRTARFSKAAQNGMHLSSIVNLAVVEAISETIPTRSQLALN